MKFTVWDLDVWGNSSEGFEVNNKRNCGTIELPENFTNEQLLDVLKKDKFLKGETTLEELSIDGDYTMINIDELESGMPLYMLEAGVNHENRKVPTNRDAKPATLSGKDDNGRDLYKDENGKSYVDVDGTLHEITESGEPLYPARSVYKEKEEEKSRTSSKQVKADVPPKPTDPLGPNEELILDPKSNTWIKQIKTASVPLFSSNDSEELNEVKEIFTKAFNRIQAKNKKYAYADKLLKKFSFADLELDKSWADAGESIPHEVYEKEAICGNIKFGDMVSRISSKVVGEVVALDDENETYLVKWSGTNQVSPHWKQELLLNK